MAWFEKALKLQQETGLSNDEVARRFGKASKTFSNRKGIYRRQIGAVEGQEERKPDYVDHGDYYTVYSGKREVEISKDKLRLLKQLYCEQKLTINQTCRELNIPRPEFMLVKNAFGITHDDIPYLDEDLAGDIDQLVEQSLERQKRQYFIKLQQKEVEALRREVLKYRQGDYFVSKIHQLVTEHDWQIDIQKVQRNTSVRQGLEVTSMAGKNLFEDMTSGEMRQRLQEVSERMDEVINERRRQLRQRNLKRDDLPADPMWNLAHDVPEIIHSSGAKKSVGGLAFEIKVDTTELDEAVEKAERLAKLINENMFVPAEVYGMSKQDLILVLVSNYGWPYLDASNFAERYW